MILKQALVLNYGLNPNSKVTLSLEADGGGSMRVGAC